MARPMPPSGTVWSWLRPSWRPRTADPRRASLPTLQMDPATEADLVRLLEQRGYEGH